MTLALDQTYPNPSSLFSYTCTGQMNSNLTTSQIACHTDERSRSSVKVYAILPEVLYKSNIITYSLFSNRILEHTYPEGSDLDILAF